jgi:hypothetical protein
MFPFQSGRKGGTVLAGGSIGRARAVSGKHKTTDCRRRRQSVVLLVRTFSGN